MEGRLIALFEQAGFRNVAERRTFGTIFGTLALYDAVRPEEVQRQPTRSES